MGTPARTAALLFQGGGMRPFKCAVAGQRAAAARAAAPTSESAPRSRSLSALGKLPSRTGPGPGRRPAGRAECNRDPGQNPAGIVTPQLTALFHLSLNKNIIFCMKRALHFSLDARDCPMPVVPCTGRDSRRFQTAFMRTAYTLSEHRLRPRFPIRPGTGSGVPIRWAGDFLVWFKLVRAPSSLWPNTQSGSRNRESGVTRAARRGFPGLPQAH
jgi:hypothetical protein